MTLLLLLLGCPETVSNEDTNDYFPEDEDQDGWTVEEGDCDDTDRSISPGQTETWYDGIDQNCDGGSDYDQDADGRGYALLDVGDTIWGQRSNPSTFASTSGDSAASISKWARSGREASTAK